MGTGLASDLDLVREEIDDSLQRFVLWLRQSFTLDPATCRRLNIVSTGLVYGVEESVQIDGTTKLDELLLKRFNFLCSKYRLKGRRIELPGMKLTTLGSGCDVTMLSRS